MEADVNAVIDGLARQNASLAVRLAVAEARIAQLEREDVERMAAQEAENGDS